MAITKISRGLLNTGVSDSSDATAITIDSSERVMIGTTDPGYPDYGDSLTLGDVDGGGGNSGMTIRSGTTSYGTFYFSDATGTAAGTYAGKMQYNHTNNSMVFATNSSDRLTIDSAGKVGIGTTSPDTEFHVKDTGSIEVRLEADSDNSGQEDCFVRFYTDGKTQEGIIGMDNNNSSSLFTTNTENAMVFGTVSNLPALIATNNTERIEVEAGGNVDVKGGNLYLTGSNDRRIKLSDSGVSGVSDSNNTVHIRGDNDSMKLMAAGNGSFIFEINGTQEMAIDSSGSVTFNSLYGSAADQNDVRYNASSGLLFYNTSSIRYKENIKDMPDGVLDKIKQARVVTFDEKGTDVSSYGLISEELDKLIPELVTRKEIDGELVPDSIVYSKIGVWVLKAMQEQQVIIEDLKSRIETLEE